jgi:hypothetical protein
MYQIEKSEKGEKAAVKKSRKPGRFNQAFGYAVKKQNHREKQKKNKAENRNESRRCDKKRNN